MTPYVPSDRLIPWISVLPSGWAVKPLKYVISINTAILPESTPVDQEIRYIDISTVSSDGSIGQPELLSFGDAPTRARRLVRAGDTIVSTVRTYLKAIAFIDADQPGLVCSTGFAVLRPGPLANPRFLFYWARSTYFVDEICARSTGVSYPAITPQEIGSLPFPLLPLDEQAAIAKFLDSKFKAFGEMLRLVQGLVSLSDSATGALLDYRDELITAAVTGRINVCARLSTGCRCDHDCSRGA